MAQRNPNAEVSDPSILTFRFAGTGKLWAPFADKLNTMIDAINGNRISAGAGLRHSRTPSGTTLSAKPVSEPVVTDHPFKGHDASEDDVPKVWLTPGSINDVIPTVYGTDMTQQDSQGNYPLLTLGNSDQIVYAQIDLDQYGSVQSVEIDSSANNYPPDNTDTTAYIVLFYVYLDWSGPSLNVTLWDNVSGSQQYQRCPIAYTNPPQYFHSFQSI